MSNEMPAMKNQQKAMVWALVTLRNETRKASQAGTRPEFGQIKRLMRYVERIAERQHQVNEERHLLRPLEAREPALARTVARLRRDRVAMKGYRLRLAEAVGYWEQGDPRSASHAPVVAQDYLDICVRHVRAERNLMAAARKVLSDAEWSTAEGDFAAVRDPLAAARSRNERQAALARFD